MAKIDWNQIIQYFIKKDKNYLDKFLRSDEIFLIH